MFSFIFAFNFVCVFKIRKKSIIYILKLTCYFLRLQFLSEDEITLSNEA